MNIVDVANIFDVFDVGYINDVGYKTFGRSEFGTPDWYRRYRRCHPHFLPLRIPAAATAVAATPVDKHNGHDKRKECTYDSDDL